MPFTHRTFLRHFAVLAVLLLLPRALMSGYHAVLWYYQHSVFYAGLLALSALIGYGAHFTVVRGLAGQWVLLAAARRFGESRSPDDLPYGWHLLYTWATCSRCVAYWTAGAASAFVSLYYWPILDYAAWAVTLRSLYFATLGASLAASVAVAIYLLFTSRATGHE